MLHVNGAKLVDPLGMFYVKSVVFKKHGNDVFDSTVNGNPSSSIACPFLHHMCMWTCT